MGKTAKKSKTQSKKKTKPNHKSKKKHASHEKSEKSYDISISESEDNSSVENNRHSSPKKNRHARYDTKKKDKKKGTKRNAENSSSSSDSEKIDKHTHDSTKGKKNKCKAFLLYYVLLIIIFAVVGTIYYSQIYNFISTELPKALTQDTGDNKTPVNGKEAVVSKAPDISSGSNKESSLSEKESAKTVLSKSAATLVKGDVITEVGDENLSPEKIKKLTAAGSNLFHSRVNEDPLFYNRSTMRHGGPSVPQSKQAVPKSEDKEMDAEKGMKSYPLPGGGRIRYIPRTKQDAFHEHRQMAYLLMSVAAEPVMRSRKNKASPSNPYSANETDAYIIDNETEEIIEDYEITPPELIPSFEPINDLVAPKESERYSHYCNIPPRHVTKKLIHQYFNEQRRKKNILYFSTSIEFNEDVLKSKLLERTNNIDILNDGIQSASVSESKRPIPTIMKTAINYFLGHFVKSTLDDSLGVDEIDSPKGIKETIFFLKDMVKKNIYKIILVLVMVLVSCILVKCILKSILKWIVRMIIRIIKYCCCGGK